MNTAASVHFGNRKVFDLSHMIVASLTTSNHVIGTSKAIPRTASAVDINSISTKIHPQILDTSNGTHSNHPSYAVLHAITNRPIVPAHSIQALTSTKRRKEAQLKSKKLRRDSKRRRRSQQIKTKIAKQSRNDHVWLKPTYPIH